ncbi:ABC-2 type transporter family protein [Trifolium repens]|nr:ABC-2 type transporter family protein [Trifolium repens]
MVIFGGKKVHQIVTEIGGSGLGQVVVAVAFSFLVRIFSAPGPALLPENDDVPTNDSPRRFAYVRQEDLFFSRLTVRETLSLAIELQLPHISSVEERDEYVDNLLFKIGLVSFSISCILVLLPSSFWFLSSLIGYSYVTDIPLASVCFFFKSSAVDTNVGDAKVRGISGGEKKRLSLACELLASPSVIFANEPTRGILFSQRPSTIIYATPITLDDLSKSRKRISKRTVAKRKGGWWKQFWLLLRRAWMQVSRDAPTNKVRARMSIASAIIFGSDIFYKVQVLKVKLKNLKILVIISDGFTWLSLLPESRGWYSQVAAINTAVAALCMTAGVFPKERSIVDRERAKGSYSLGPYLLSKLMAETPIRAAFSLLFGVVLYPMAQLHPTLVRFGKF